MTNSTEQNHTEGHTAENPLAEHYKNKLFEIVQLGDQNRWDAVSSYFVPSHLPESEDEGLTDIEEIEKMEDNRIKYIANGLLNQGGTLSIIGPSKHHKSFLALNLACSLANGTPFLGEFEVMRKSKVLYISKEGSIYMMRDRILMMMEKEEWIPHKNNVYFYPEKLARTFLIDDDRHFRF